MEKKIILTTIVLMSVAFPVQAQFGGILNYSLARSQGEEAVRREMAQEQAKFSDFYGWCTNSNGWKVVGVGENYIDPTAKNPWYNNQCIVGRDLWNMRDVIRRKNDLYKKLMSAPVCK